MPLNPQVSLHPFEKWVIDFIGLIHPPRKRTSARYVITMTEYLTRRAKSQPVKDCIGATTIKILFKYVLTRFGYLKVLMRNKGKHFLNKMISALTDEF